MIGLTFDIPSNQLGKPACGNSAVLVKTSGKVAKFTIATRESILFTESARAVKTQERANASRASAPNTPMKSEHAKSASELKSVGKYNRNEKCEKRQRHRLYHVLQDSREVD